MESWTVNESLVTNSGDIYIRLAVSCYLADVNEVQLISPTLILTGTLAIIISRSTKVYMVLQIKYTLGQVN